MKTLTPQDVTSLACHLLSQYGLHDWTFGYDRAKRRAGLCKHRHKIITLSIHFVLRNNEEEIKDTLLHEIAHALAGPGYGHGAKWRAICRQIGAKPVRCYSSDKVNMPRGRYKAICNNCCKVFYRHRKPKGVGYYCPKCGPVLGAIKFHEN